MTPFALQQYRGIKHFKNKNCKF